MDEREHVVVIIIIVIIIVIFTITIFGAYYIFALIKEPCSLIIWTNFIKLCVSGMNEWINLCMNYIRLLWLPRLCKSPSSDLIYYSAVKLLSLVVGGVVFKREINASTGIKVLSKTSLIFCPGCVDLRCVQTCVCVCSCLCVCVCVCLYLCVFVTLCLCVFCVCVCVCVCMFVCICRPMRMCLCVLMFVCACAGVYVCLWLCVFVYVRAWCVWVSACMCVYVCICVCMCMCLCVS